MSPRKCTKGGRKQNICGCMLGAVLGWRMFGKAPSEMSALQPYRGKPAVRNDRGDRGNVGIIEARSAPRSYPTIKSGRQQHRPTSREIASFRLSRQPCHDSQAVNSRIFRNAASTHHFPLHVVIELDPSFLDHLRTVFAGDLESRLNVVREFVELYRSDS